jgi:hypothetical protein
MNKVEAQDILGFIDDHCTIHPDDWDKIVDYIDSRVTDTDPRLAMLDELETRIINGVVAVRTSTHWGDGYAVGVKNAIDGTVSVIQEQRDRIKQEVGDAE